MALAVPCRMRNGLIAGTAWAVTKLANAANTAPGRTQNWRPSIPLLRYQKKKFCSEIRLKKENDGGRVFVYMKIRMRAANGTTVLKPDPSNIDQEAEKRQWEELAVASGMHLGGVDLQDSENTKELCGLLRVQGIGPTSRLRTYIKGLQSMPQHQQMIPAETLAGLKATGSAKKNILDMLELTEAGASWPNKLATILEFPSFQWLPGKENSPESRVAYKAHLASNVWFPTHISMVDVQPDRTSLSVEILDMKNLWNHGCCHFQNIPC
eukprot:scaffold1323_cov160-Amphora_coffeaeformis.AAC.11